MCEVTEACDPLAPLRRRFINRLIDDRATLAGGVEVSENAVVAIAHRLAGLAGTLGYPEISSAAKALEAALAGEKCNSPAASEALALLLHKIDLLLGVRSVHD